MVSTWTYVGEATDVTNKLKGTPTSIATKGGKQSARSWVVLPYAQRLTQPLILNKLRVLFRAARQARLPRASAPLVPGSPTPDVPDVRST